MSATPEPDVPPHVTAVMGRLRRWANRLRGRYGVPIYLCGSALRADNPDPRDWDVRIMLPDERFALAFGPVDEWRDEGCTGKWMRTRWRWSDQCVKDTQDFAAWCALNGDVQIYPESHAAKLYADAPRFRLDTYPDEADPELFARLAAVAVEKLGLRETAALLQVSPASVKRYAAGRNGPHPVLRDAFVNLLSAALECPA